MDECPVCRIPLSVSMREKCPSPACPCFGLAVGSAEMERAARSAVARPFSRRGANVTGAEARALLETQFPDPVEVKARAFVHARSASTMTPNLTGYEALARLGVSAVGHEPGWP